MATDREILDFQLSLDPSKAIKAAQRFETEMSRRLKLISKHEDTLNTSIGKYLYKVGQAKKIFGPVLKEQMKLYEDTTKAIVESRQAIDAYSKSISNYESDLTRMSAVMKELEKTGGSKEQLAGLKAQITSTQKLKDEKEALKKAAMDDRSTLESTLSTVAPNIQEAKQQIEIDPYAFSDAAKEAGNEILKPFATFARKDFPGFLEEGGSLAAKAFKGFKAMGKMDTGSKDMGVALKGITGMSKKMQPILGMISKMGPMLTLASSFILGLVKLFVDAEGAAKEFNKQVLETTSMTGHMTGAMRDVGAAAKSAEQTVRAAYDSAMDYSRNLSRNLSKDTHAAVLASLGAEGMPLQNINKQILQIKESGMETAKSIRDVGDVTWQAVAYSRQFGVSLNGITQLQGEMMTEVGMGLTAVRTSFAELERGAEEAGMASNKFFGIVRSFSADLSLFTLRMQDLTKVMTVLGKTMSPRNAQKFLQTVTNQFKGAGLMDRTKSTLLAGKGATKNILQDDATRRIEGLLADLKDIGIGDELKGVIAGGDTKAAVEFMSKFAGQISGAQREAILDATMMQGKLNSGNMVEIASALKDASPIAAIQMLDQISQKRFSKPMDQLVGIQKIAFENMTGFNDEQIDQQRKMVAGLQQVQYDLAAKIEKGDENLTAVEEDMLKKLGINAKDADAAEEIRNKNSNEIWHSMDTSQKDMLKAADETEKFQAKISDLTQKITDKMTVLVDWAMGKFYNTILDIYDAISGIASSWPFGSKKSEPRKGFVGDKGPTTDKKRAQYKAMTGAVSSLNPQQRAAYDERVRKAGGRKKLTLKQQYDMAVGLGGKPRAKEKAAPVEVKKGPQEERQKETTDSIKKVDRTLKKGLMLDKASPAYKSALTDSTLNAIRKGLFEYYLYSGIDRSQMAAGMMNGMDPMQYIDQFMGQVASTGSVNAAHYSMMGNARGGVVTGLAGRMASVDNFPPPPPGEGWAAVGPGETIVPAGGRGGGGGRSSTIELRLKGDLGRFVDARVVDGVAEFQRNKKLR